MHIYTHAYMYMYTCAILPVNACILGVWKNIEEYTHPHYIRIFRNNLWPCTTRCRWLCVADIGGRESKEQLLDTVKSFIHIIGSGLSHTTTQRRRESISPENALRPRYFVYIYIYIIHSVCSWYNCRTPAWDSDTGVSVLILTNHLKTLLKKFDITEFVFECSCNGYHKWVII